MTESVQLLGISNAIVDVLAHVDEAFLEKVGVPRGAMTLIDEERAHELYDMMGPATEMSGGSVANTVAGFAILGAGTISIPAPSIAKPSLIAASGARTVSSRLE